jgi:hypothetical protein
MEPNPRIVIFIQFLIIASAMWYASVSRLTPLAIYAVLAIASALVTGLFAKFMHAGLPRPLLWVLTVLSVVGTFTVILLFVLPVHSEGQVYLYATILVYLLIPLVFVLPLTVAGWIRMQRAIKREAAT